MTLEVAYAYATSKHAADVGMADTGAYVVLRTHKRDGNRLRSPVLAIKRGFPTRDAATLAMAGVK
jgi:hypothetical protein